MALDGPVVIHPSVFDLLAWVVKAVRFADGKVSPWEVKALHEALAKAYDCAGCAALIDEGIHTRRRRRRRTQHPPSDEPILLRLCCRQCRCGCQQEMAREQDQHEGGGRLGDGSHC